MALVFIIGLIIFALVGVAALIWQTTYGDTMSWRPPERRDEWQGDYGGGFLLDGLFPLGRWFFGLWGDAVAVAWDEPDGRDRWRR